MIDEETAPLFDAKRWPVYASYGIVLGMVISFAIVMVQFLQWISPTWDARGMITICILAAIETVASRWLVQRLPTAERQIIFFRLTEWAIILVILKLVTELLVGPANLWNNLSLWPVNFPFNILNARFWLTVALFAVIWGISFFFDKDLSLLGTFETSLLDERVKLTPVRDLILRRFLNVGMIVVVLAGIPRQVAIPPPQPAPTNGAIPAVVMYFILGIALLSLTRYASLVTNWRQSKINVPIQVSRRWLAYSGVILAILVLLIFWLPTNYGMGILDTITAIVGIIYQALATVYAIIFILINALFRLLFHTTAGAVPPLVIPPTPPPATPLPPVTPSAINWTLIKSILFWVGLVVLAIVALRQYIAFNKDLSDELKRFRPLKWLSIFWKRFTASVKKANTSVGIFVQSSLKRLREAGRSPTNTGDWAYLNPRRLDSRQKIIFYYLALLRRADEAGLPRQDGQTPYEYANSLTSKLEEGQDGVADLTDSFVEARYSRHDIPDNTAQRAETLWETIRRVLRTVRKSKQAEKKAKD